MKSLFFENKNSVNLIVFVHGLRGNPKDTWTYNDGDKDFFWPEQLAQNDPAFNNADVYSFGYHSECGPTLNIREIAKSMEIRINQKLEKKQYKSISFVAHSMGGLVVCEFILNRHEHLKQKIPIESVITLSTPNLGSGLATFSRHFCKNIQMDELKRGREGFLDNLNDRWRDRFEQGDGRKTFFLAAGYELVNTSLIGLIVEKDSAVRFAQHTHSFIKDHSGIAKPTDLDDELYQWVKQELLQKPQNLQAVQRTEAREKRTTEIIADLQKKLQGTDLKEALALIVRGNSDKALTLLSEQEEKEDQEVLKIAQVRFTKAQIYELKLDYQNARTYYEKAVNLAPENTQYLNGAGLNALTLSAYDKALELHSKALKIQLRVLGNQHADVARSYTNIGAVWHFKGAYDKAIEFHSKALKIQLRVLGSQHRDVATSYNNIGSAWHLMGKYDKAIEFYSKALKIQLKVFGSHPSDVAKSYNNIGGAWHLKGAYDKAMEFHSKALEIDLKAFGSQNHDVATRYNNIGGVWYAKGEYDKAIEFHSKALKIDLKVFGGQHINVAFPYNNIGDAWHAKGVYDKAVEFYSKAFNIFEARLGNHHPHTEVVRKNLEEARRLRALEND